MDSWPDLFWYIWLPGVKELSVECVVLSRAVYGSVAASSGCPRSSASISFTCLSLEFFFTTKEHIYLRISSFSSRCRILISEHLARTCGRFGQAGLSGKGEQRTLPDLFVLGRHRKGMGIRYLTYCGPYFVQILQPVKFWKIIN